MWWQVRGGGGGGGGGWAWVRGLSVIVLTAHGQDGHAQLCPWPTCPPSAAVELLPEEQWRGPSNKLPSGAAAGGDAAGDAAGGEAEAEAAPDGAHIAQVDPGEHYGEDAAAAGGGGRRPTGKVVGVIKRNWRTRGYCGSLQVGGVGRRGRVSGSQQWCVCAGMRAPSWAHASLPAHTLPHSRSSRAAGRPTRHTACCSAPWSAASRTYASRRGRCGRRSDTGQERGAPMCRGPAAPPAARCVLTPALPVARPQAATLADKRLVVAVDSWEADSLYPSGHYVRTLGAIGDKETETEVGRCRGGSCALAAHGVRRSCRIPPASRPNTAAAPACRSTNTGAAD